MTLGINGIETNADDEQCCPKGELLLEEHIVNLWTEFEIEEKSFGMMGKWIEVDFILIPLITRAFR